MRLLRELPAETTRPTPPCVAAVGNFDGVHVGHQRLLAAAREEAGRRGLETVAVSFVPHPARILQPRTAPPLITPEPEKIRQLEACGVDTVLLLPFTRDLSLLSPLEFAERVLVRGLRVAAVYEGENFRFGHRGQGDGARLRELGREFGFDTTIMPRLEMDGAPVSSSRIRGLVGHGQVAEAGRLLGRAFRVVGLIAPGRGVGRQRTVPTLNLQHYEELLPARGVYYTRVRLGDAAAGAGEAGWAALTNVGVRPTFGDGGPLTVESYLLHPPEGGIAAGLGDRLAITFLDRLREERKFDSPEALREQIQQDIGRAETFFSLTH